MRQWARWQSWERVYEAREHGQGRSVTADLADPRLCLRLLRHERRIFPDIKPIQRIWLDELILAMNRAAHQSGITASDADRSLALMVKLTDSLQLRTQFRHELEAIHEASRPPLSPAHELRPGLTTGAKATVITSRLAETQAQGQTPVAHTRTVPGRPPAVVTALHRPVPATAPIAAPEPSPAATSTAPAAGTPGTEEEAPTGAALTGAVPTAGEPAAGKPATGEPREAPDADRVDEEAPDPAGLGAPAPHPSRGGASSARAMSRAAHPAYAGRRVLAARRRAARAADTAPIAVVAQSGTATPSVGTGQAANGAQSEKPVLLASKGRVADVRAITAHPGAHRATDATDAADGALDVVHVPPPVVIPAPAISPFALDMGEGFEASARPVTTPLFEDVRRRVSAHHGVGERVDAWLDQLIQTGYTNPLIAMDPTSPVLVVPGEVLGEVMDLMWAQVPLALIPAPTDHLDCEPDAAIAANTMARTLLTDQHSMEIHLSAAEYSARLRGLDRAARRATEEHGSSSLYLTLGEVTWTDGDHRGRAPLFVIPVSVEEADGMFRLHRDPSRDAGPNWCLLEKLRTAKITVWADPDGITDLDEAIGAVERALLGAQSFTVHRGVHLAQLPYANLSMWQDLQNHWPTFRERTVVRRLVGYDAPPLAALETQDHISAATQAATVTPLPADAAQLDVVHSAAAGASFVVHGPPGTGKSQTIANLIAQCVGQGKKVLFVAPKRAALDSVHRRLRRVGLAGFCLDLHQEAPGVAQQITAALDAGLDGDNDLVLPVPTDYGDTLHFLETYPQVLHHEGPAELSAWQAHERVAELAGAGDRGASTSRGGADAAKSVDLAEPTDTATPAGLATLADAAGLRVTREAVLDMAVVKGIYHNAQALRSVLVELGPEPEFTLSPVGAGGVGPAVSTRWAMVRYYTDRLQQLGVQGVSDIISHRTADEVERAVALAVAREILAERLDTELRGFDAEARTAAISRLADLEPVAQDIAAAAVATRALGQRASLSEDDVAQLRQALATAAPVKDLLAAHGQAIMQVTPCFMASPQAVARSLPADATFDVVVFDEASQIRTAEAIGAMGRAHAVVIAGDLQQLPPAALTQPASSTQAAGPTPPAQPDSPDQSVMAAALAAGLPSLGLTWHYRSRDESLITFSNAHYYDGVLAAFPSPPTPSRAAVRVRWAGAQDAWVGVVPDDEAAGRVAAELATTLRVHPGQSIGVVTLDAAHRDRILAYLDQHPDAAVTAALGAEDEPLFVKALADVQGDERDLIFLTITGKPSELSAHDGPFGGADGRARLNVAVTRARDEVRIICSADLAEQNLPDPDVHRAPGFADLLAYVRGAAERRTPHRGSTVAGDLPPAQGAEITPATAHGAQVARALVTAGLEVRCDVGQSEFRVDVAARTHGAAAWVAVLFDGPAWARRRSVSDRETLPVSGLMARGWGAVERVWLPQWVQDPEKVVARVVALAQEVGEQANPAQDLCVALGPVEPEMAGPTSADEPTAECPGQAEGTGPGTGRDEDQTAELPKVAPPRDRVAWVAPLGNGPAVIPPLPPLPPTPPAPRGGPASGRLVGGPASAGLPVMPSTHEVTTMGIAVTHKDTFMAVPRPRQTFAGASPGQLRPRAVLDSRDRVSRQAVRDELESVVSAEGPILVDRLLAITAHRFGVATVTDARRQDMLKALPRVARTLAANGDVVVWPAAVDRHTYSAFRVPGEEREITEVPYEELRNAMVHRVTYSPLPERLTAAEAMRLTMSEFGWPQLTGPVQRRLAGVLTAAISEGFLAVNDGVVGLGDRSPVTAAPADQASLDPTGTTAADPTGPDPATEPVTELATQP